MAVIVPPLTEDPVIVPLTPVTASGLIAPAKPPTKAKPVTLPPAAERVIVPPPFIAPTKPPTAKPGAFVTENPNDPSIVAAPAITPMKPPALPWP